MRSSLFLLLMLIIGVVASGQSALPDFTGYKIFINPGHGGYDSDDRHMLTTDFWESEGNLVKGLFLREIMTKMKATVYMSRTTNNTADDLPLSSISAMANSANVDFFLAIHSNGFDGNQNQPLMLYKGYDNQPAFSEAKVMAGILWQKIFERGNCWTNSNVWVKGDWTFYPEWGTQGLGVLRSLAMPGVLSEGSFHDYIPESWRLRNSDFLHLESWAFARAFLEYKSVTPVSNGLITGIIRDPLKSPTWYFKPGTKDAGLPLNGAKVTLKPGNRVKIVDNLNNGFFMFDSVAPGSYKLYIEGVKDYMNDSVEVTVEANKSLLTDIALRYDTALVPKVINVLPSVTDSLVFNQEFTFVFDLSMNPDSVQKALSFNPSVNLVYSWDEKKTVLKVKPDLKYASKTNYTITLSRSACSSWKVKIATPFQLSFVTRNRTRLNLEKSYPGNGQKKVTLFPQIRLFFDAPPDQAGITTNIQFLNEAGAQLSRVKEEFSEINGKGNYYFELSDPLELNKNYRIVINPGLSDIAGTKFGQTKEIIFTTRESGYQTGNMIEPFDDIARFWDPDASGSTVGTDNPLTTFTSSATVKKSGTASGKLNYVFINPDGGVCRVFNSYKPFVGSDISKDFGIWVFGDFSYNALEYWFYSSGITNQIVSVDTIDWAGWDLKTIPFSKIGGSGDQLFHSVVISQTTAGTKSGTIYFDDAQLLIPTSIAGTYRDEADLSSYPNPFISASTISFTLKERASVKLEVYSVSGQLTDQIFEGESDPGNYLYNWTPKASIGSGVYFFRLEYHNRSRALPVVSIKKCMLIR